MVTVWKHSNLPVMFATWIWAVCANLAVVLFTALANRCWSLGLMFGDWLMLWLTLTILFSKACSIHLHYAIHFTMLGKAKRLIESNHPSERNIAWQCGVKLLQESLCEAGSYAQTLFALMSEDTLKKVGASVRGLTEVVRKVFLWIDNMHRANCPFHLH